MTSCPNCQHANAPTARFCGNCRHELKGTVVQDAPQGAMNPTLFEEGGADMAPIRGFQPGDFKRGGAADATVQEGHPGAGQYQHGAAGHTMLHEDACEPIAGWLVVLRSRSMPLYKDIPIFHGTNTLGKNPGRVEHVIDDSVASRTHCMLVGSEQGVDLTDLNSSNGTFVNNKQVRMQSLAKGDMVKIGKTTMVFVPVPQQA